MAAMQRPPGGAVGRAVPSGHAHSGMPAVLTQGPDTAKIGRAPHDGNFALLLEIASLPSSHRMHATAMVSPAVSAASVSVKPLAKPAAAAQSIVAVQESLQRAVSTAFGRSASSSPEPTGQSVRSPDPKQGGRIAGVVFLVVAAIIGTQVLKSVLGLSLEDSLPLLVLAGIAYAVFRKRRGPPQN